MLRIAAGTYDQVLLALAALAEHYGWNGRVGYIMADLVLNKEKAERILADALPALPGAMELPIETSTYH